MKNIIYIVGLAILLLAVLGFIWSGWQSNQLAEKNAWVACINRAANGTGDANSASLADNLICRSLYPNAYKIWHAEFYQ